MNWIFELLKKSSFISAELLVSSFFINLFGLASAIFVMQVYGRYLTHGLDATLITLSIGMFIIISIEYLLRNSRYKIAQALIIKRDKKASFNLFDTFLRADTEHLMRMKTGMRQSLLNKSEQMQNILNPAFFTSVIDVPFAFIYLAAIFYISSFIGWVVLILLFTAISISFLLSSKIQKYTKEQLESNAQVSDISKSIEHFEMIKVNGASNLVKNKYEDSLKEAKTYKYLISSQQNKMQSINQSMTLLLSTLVIALGAREVTQGNIDFGMLIGMNILAARTMMILSRPMASLSSLFRANQTKKMVDNFLKIPTIQKEGITLKNFKTNLELADVTYGYGKGPIFERVSVKIPRGSLVKIIGSNGKGKTTLSRLLVGLFHPRRGMILADGVDIRQLDLNWWNKQLVYVPQEPQFINTTLKENLTVLNPAISDEELSQIVKDSNLEEFINLSVDGLEMKISENGKELPLGIRRRLSLARALCTKGSIMIIDEPTDGLDVNGIAAIGNLINVFLKEQKTVIVLTHDQNLIQANGIIIDLNHKPIPKITY